MSKYETMIVVKGSLREPEAKKVLDEVKKIIKDIKTIDVTEMGHKKLSYEIDNETMGYYFVLNFETEDASLIAELRRLILLNRSVIRHLIINLEKDYGYKATINPKKVAKSNYRAKIYKDVQEKIKKEQESQEVRKRDSTPVKLTDI
ncbi:MAG: 30S ribosomal protein S6 [Mycoplasmoidaceae bacterium]